MLLSLEDGFPLVVLPPLLGHEEFGAHHLSRWIWASVAESKSVADHTNVRQIVGELPLRISVHIYKAVCCSNLWQRA